MPYLDGTDEGQSRREVLDMTLEPMIAELKKAPKLEAELEYCFYQMILQTHKVSFTDLNASIGTLMTTILCLYMTILGPYEMQKLSFAWLGDKVAPGLQGDKKAPKKEDREQK